MKGEILTTVVTTIMAFFPGVTLAQTGSVNGRQFRGRYANVDYGFSVEIPAGLVGEGTAAPNPNHGFAIKLDEKSVVWADASYDMDDPHRFGKLNSRLGTLRAERKAWNTTGEGREQEHLAIIARGFDRGTPIIFTIEADTDLQHRDEALRVFEGIVRSFRTFPVRP